MILSCPHYQLIYLLFILCKYTLWMPTLGTQARRKPDTLFALMHFMAPVRESNTNAAKLLSRFSRVRLCVTP